MNNVKIIADSKNEFGQRLITAVLTFPRYLLAEVNTHRMLSRNSASSRAIRFEKMVQSVMENPFIPFKWQKDHAGMQGSDYITNPMAIQQLEKLWLKGRDTAVERAKAIHGLYAEDLEFVKPSEYLTDFEDEEEIKISKQLCNRLLEPFMYHTALVSGTELENFFALRAQDAAEIHFQDLAYKFLDAVNASEPKQLQAGEWHIPFGDQINIEDLDPFYYNEHLLHYGWMPKDEEYSQTVIDKLKVKIATVRAARISYAIPGSEMKHDYEADLKLHDRLASSGHWSAFEHCAKVMTKEEFYSHINGKYPTGTEREGNIYNMEYYPYACEENKDNLHDYLGFSGANSSNGNRYGWCGNFRGFIQYRKMFSDENRSDSRLIQK